MFISNFFFICFPRRAHDANLIKLAKKYLAEHDTKGITPTVLLYEKIPDVAYCFIKGTVAYFRKMYIFSKVL